MRQILALLMILFLALPAMAQTRDPVGQTPLATEGKSLQMGIVAPRDGLVSSIATIDRSPTQAKNLNNLQMLKRGVWTNRGIGWTKQRPSTFNSGAEFKDFATFVDATGTETLCFQVGNTLYSYNVGTSTETAISSMTTLNTSAVPCMRNYSPSTSTAQPILVYANGDIEPRKVTSTSASSALLFNSPGVWPGTFNSKSYSKPKFCEPFSDRMVYSGFNGASTAFDLLISNQADAEKFTVSAPLVATDAVAFTVPAILGPIRGMRSYKLTNETNDEVLLIGCSNGMAVITGSNATTFSLRILTRAHGLANNRCWVQVDNGLYYLSTDGVRSYAGLVSGANLINSALTFGIQDQINKIDFSSIAGAHAFHYPKTQEVQFWVPFRSESGVCKHALVMNYNNDRTSPQLVFPVWSTKDGTSVSSSAVFGGVAYGGGYNGILQSHYSGSNYDGSPIIFSYVTPLINLGNPIQTARSRKVVVLTDGNEQGFVIRPFTYSKIGDDNTVRRPATPAEQELVASVGTATILGSWLLARDDFPSEHIKTLSFAATGNGIAWEYEISSSSSDHIIDLIGLQFILSGGGIER